MTAEQERATRKDKDMSEWHEPDCFLSGGDDGRFPCICVKRHGDRLRNGDGGGLPERPPLTHIRREALG